MVMIANSGSIAVNANASGVLINRSTTAGEPPFYSDVRSITLAAGRDYTFSLDSAEVNGYSGVYDTILRLYDAQGILVAYDDDSGVGLNSLLSFNAYANGTYFLEASSYGNNYNGGYTLTTTGTIPVNHAPTFTVANQANLETAHRNQAYTISEDSLLQGFNDEDGDVLHVSNLRASSGTLTNNNNGTWTITPAAAGNVTLNYSVTDGQAGGSIAASNQFVVDAPATLVTAINVTRVDDGHTTEAGGTARYSVSVNTAPANGNVVSIAFTSSDVSEGRVSTGAGTPAASATVSFNAANWHSPQIITVTGQQDYLPDGNLGYTVTGIASQTVPSTGYTTAIRNFSGANSSGENRLNLVNDADLTATGVDRDAAVYLVGDDGRPQEDILFGSDGADRLYGGYMIDELHGGIGGDRLYGAYEDDALFGDIGDDQLYGEQDDDYLDGGAGNDRLDGGIGADTLIGGDGSDVFYVTLGDDGLVEDTITESLTGAGVDTLYVPFAVENYTAPTGVEILRMNAGFGETSITGNASNNQLFGNAGDNTENGGAGNDALSGGAGSDNLGGGVGNDTLTGGVGRDTLEGGAGADQFRIDSTAPTNVDNIADFDPAADLLQLQFNTFGTVLGTSITSDEFRIGTAAANANQHIIYNSTTGNLYYDANGSSAGQVFLIGTLDPGVLLSFNDFQVYI